MKPKVSICIPTYNQRSDYFRTAVQSALDQQYDSFEVVVSENHSTNGCDSVLSEFCNSKLRVVQPSQHLNMGENFNFCAQASLGDYLHFLGSDDLLHPQFCTSLAPILDSYPNVVAVCCVCVPIGSDGKELATAPPPQAFSIRSGIEELLRYVWGPAHNFVGTLIRRTAYERAGGVDPHLQYVGDWDLDLRLLPLGDLAHSSHALIYYRFWRSRDRDARTVEQIQQTRLLFEKHERLGTFKPISPKILLQARKRWAIAYAVHLNTVSFNGADLGRAMNEIVQLHGGVPVRIRLLMQRLGMGSLLGAWQRLRFTIGAMRRRLQQVPKRVIKQFIDVPDGTSDHQ
jgi:GT2 family glycosyltransferase